MKNRIVNNMIFIIAALLLSSCVSYNSTYMKRNDFIVKPPEGKVLVNFLSPKGYLGFHLWDGDKFIGFAGRKVYFQYFTNPGKHIFMAVGENQAFMEADIDLGKEYYVLIVTNMGAWTPRVGFLPVNKSSKYWPQIHTWKTKLHKIDPRFKEIKKWDELYKKKAKHFIEYFKTEYKKTGKYQVLNPEDGK